ncbi:MAG: hypothetical protein WC378_20355, partial [Opitutaceae bacterium]
MIVLASYVSFLEFLKVTVGWAARRDFEDYSGCPIPPNVKGYNQENDCPKGPSQVVPVLLRGISSYGFTSAPLRMPNLIGTQNVM